MTRLFNSKGEYIANVVNERLYAPSGENIGRKINSGDFVNMNGTYLGEIVKPLSGPYQDREMLARCPAGFRA